MQWQTLQWYSQQQQQQQQAHQRKIQLTQVFQVGFVSWIAINPTPTIYFFLNSW